VSFKSVVTAIAISFILTGCVINKTVNLEPDQLSLYSTERETREIKITSPSVGEEILVFGDYISGGNIVDGTVVVFDNYKRADFKYHLENDVKPGLEDVFNSFYKINEQSSQSVEADINFKYYIPSTGAFSNVIGIVMKVKLTEFQGEEAVSQKLYVVNQTETYSTFPVTFPREGSFRSLYTKALNDLMTQLER